MMNKLYCDCQGCATVAPTPENITALQEDNKRVWALLEDERTRAHKALRELSEELMSLQSTLDDNRRRIEFLETYVSDFERANEAEAAVKVLARLLSDASE